MYTFNNNNNDLFNKFGLQGGQQSTIPQYANFGNVPAVNKYQPAVQKQVLSNPMAVNNIPKQVNNNQDNQFGFRDNDYRVNFNINNFNPNNRSNFKDSFGGYTNPLSGFPTSSTKIDYHPTQGYTSNQHVPQYKQPTITAIPPHPVHQGYNPPQQAYRPPTINHIPYGQQQYGGYGPGGNGSAPTTANLDPVVKLADQYQAPPLVKPSPTIDNNQQKQIADIMKNNADVDKSKMMDMANLGKVIYGAALSSSATCQKYTSILNDLKAQKKKFTDSDFPPDKSSLAPPTNQGEYRDVASWKRASEIFKNPQLFEGKIEPNDIMQGNLGDCYLLSTLSAIAEDPNRIKKLFISQDTSPEGIYAVDLVWRGANTQVILDDHIACDKNDNPYFLKSKNNELWVILLEKAWAKLHKNYHRLDGQLTKETLHDYTGAPTRSFRTNKDQDQLWNKMVDGDEKGYIMTTGTEGDDCGAGDPLRKFGLVSGHAYTLIGAANVKLNSGETVKLVKVRNPWGEFEWTGKWSDKDSLWNNVSASEKQRIGYSVEDDGTFFLEYKNMLEYFDGVQICYYNNNFSYQGQLFRSSYKDSKYFEVKIPTTGFYYFNISQLSIRNFDEDYQDNPNSHYSDTKFCIVNANGEAQQAFSGKKRDLYSPKYIEAPKQFQAGTYYAYVRVNWQKSATHSFGFGSYGPGKIEIKEIQPAQAGKLPSLVDPWDKGYQPQFEFEQIALI